MVFVLFPSWLLTASHGDHQLLHVTCEHDGGGSGDDDDDDDMHVSQLGGKPGLFSLGHDMAALPSPILTRGHNLRNLACWRLLHDRLCVKGL